MTTLTPAKIQVQRIRAIGLTVTDADKSKEFYIQALSFKPVSDITVEGQAYSNLEAVAEAKIRIITLQLGDELIELMEYLNIEGKPIPPDSQSNDLWFHHFAIVVSDMDRAYAHIQSFGIDHISPEPTIPLTQPTSGGVRAFKFKDPDGHDLELIWFPPGKGRDKWHQDTDHLFLGIDHTAITIANTEESLQFYHDLLGMEIESRTLNLPPPQGRLDNLAGAEVRITELSPVEDSMGIELLDYIEPAKGRPIPRDWKSSDISHVQVELVVNNIEQTVAQLRQKGIQFVSPQLVQFPANSFPYRQGCLVEDPNGHTMLLITD